MHSRGPAISVGSSIRGTGATILAVAGPETSFTLKHSANEKPSTAPASPAPDGGGRFGRDRSDPGNGRLAALRPAVAAAAGLGAGGSGSDPGGSFSRHALRADRGQDRLRPWRARISGGESGGAIPSPGAAPPPPDDHSRHGAVDRRGGGPRGSPAGRAG